MTEPLPDLETKLKGDVSDLVKAFAEATAAEKAYADENSKTTNTVTQNSKKQTDASADFKRLVTANMKDGQTALQALQGEYAKTSKVVADFRTEFTKSGSSASFVGLKDAEADLSKLKGYLEDAGHEFGQKGGQEAAFSFADAFQGGLTSPGALTAFAAAAVPILAAIDGVISAGIGVGGIAVGIAAAAHTPAVQSAFGQLKTTAGGVFTDIGKSFSAPVAAGVGDITGMLRQAEPGLKSTFAALAEGARPLIDGVSGFVSSALPGLESALRNSLPFVEELANDLPGLGASIGEMFNEFTQGGPGAQSALHDTIALIGDLAKAAGWAGSEAGALWQPYGAAIDFVTGSFRRGIDEAGGFTVALNAIQSPIDTLSTGTKGLTRDFYDLDNAFNTWITDAEAADNATLALAKDQSTFNSELKKGAKNWNESTAAGQKQVGNLNQLTDSLTKTWAAKAKLSDTTVADLQAELKSATALLNTAKAAGATSDELSTLQGIVNGLTDDLNAVPKTVKIKVDYTTQFLTEGTPPSQYYHGAANSGIVGSDGVPHFADSGVYNGAPTGGIYKTAENGPEANIAKYGDKNRALTTLAEAAGWFSDDINRTVNTGGGGVQAPIVVNLVLDSKVVATQLISPVNRMNGRSSTSVYGVH